MSALHAEAARILRDAADHAERDTRSRTKAVATLWSRLHAEPDAIRLVFDALAAEAGVSDVSAYLGPVLRKRTPAERAAMCRAAADAVERQV